MVGFDELYGCWSFYSGLEFLSVNFYGLYSIRFNRLFPKFRHNNWFVILYVYLWKLFLHFYLYQ